MQLAYDSHNLQNYCLHRNKEGCTGDLVLIFALYIDPELVDLFTKKAYYSPNTVFCNI